jgi:hypothetical protein
MGAYYAIMGNIPSLAESFLDDTPLSAIKGKARVLSLPALAGFAFLAFCFYVLYMFRRAFRVVTPNLDFPLRVSALGLLLSFLLLIICVSQAKIKFLFNIFILLGLVILISYKHLKTQNPRLSSLLMLASGVLLILVSGANLARLGTIAADNPSAAVIRHRAAIVRISYDFALPQLYALYPDSYPLEALSDGSFKVGALMPDLMPFVMGQSTGSFSPSQIGGRVGFVMPLKGKISQTYRNVESDPLLTLASNRLRIDDRDTPIDVLIFERNPFTYAGRKAAYPEVDIISETDKPQDNPNIDEGEFAQTNPPRIGTYGSDTENDISQNQND